jgi:tight adherence protein B
MSATLLAILAAVLGFIVVAGFGFALAGPSPAQARAAKRTQAILGREPRDAKARRASGSSQDQRRKQILQSLKEQDRQQRKASLSLGARLQQAGLSINVRTFWLVSAGLGISVFLLVLMVGQASYVALGLGFAAGLGLPRWIVAMMAARRIKKFIGAFPDAMDIIVRGIKSGLPVNDSLRIIGAEAPEPLASEFKSMTENTGMGVSIDQAIDRMYERMPAQEVRFFGIVLAIQQKTGGNLAEALGNLSTVIRARKLMREKIKALSGEAVASAFIIGSLPPAVVIMITLMAPEYMAPLFTDVRGRLILLGGALLMGMGIWVMRRMIRMKI